MSQITDMIETLAAAKVAMEENPSLKARIAELEAQVTHLQMSKADLEVENEALQGELASDFDRISTLEANLDATRFQELANREKLEALVSSFRSALDEVVPVDVSTPSDANVEVVDKPAIDISEATETKEWSTPTISEVTTQYTGGEAPAEPSVVIERPYLGKPYSFKPPHLTWSEWLAGGGDRPWWLTEAELIAERETLKLSA